MADLRLRYNNSTGLMELQLVDDDLAVDDGLETAVLLSLFLDRRARDGDIVPGGDQEDRRGHWADEFGERDGDEVGSRLWLLDRAPLIPGTVSDAETYASEALSWLLDDGLARSVEPSATVDGKHLSLVVVVTRPEGDAISYRFSSLWDGVAGYAV